MRFDTLLINGLVFDGGGGPPLRRTIGIKEGLIFLPEPGLEDPEAQAGETFDLEGLWVMPGFLDIHTHYDIEVELDPYLRESLKHGVTSVVMGNCSLSTTFGEPADLADIFQRVETIPAVLLRKWLIGAGPRADAAAYFGHLRSLDLGMNVGALLGHSALRAKAMGLERSLREHATAGDLERMETLARAALAAGCLGISVDMVPWHMMSGIHKGLTVPSQHADMREYRMLAALCRETDAVFQATPNPQRPMTFLHLLRMSVPFKGRPLRMTVLTALDVLGKPWIWRIFPAICFIINRVCGGNLRFQTLAEPFTIRSDGPITPLFEEFGAGVALNDAEGPAARRALWDDADFRARFVRDWKRLSGAAFHRRLDRMTVLRCPGTDWTGRTFADIARSQGRPPLEFFMDALAAHDTALRWEATGGNHRGPVRKRLLAHPHILPGFTDAGAHLRNLGFYDGALSVIRQAAADGPLSVGRAVRRVTSEPAQWFRIPAGSIRQGARADLAILDPARLGTRLPAPVERPDPLLDGGIRMVKNADPAVVSVYVGGARLYHRGVFHDQPNQAHPAGRRSFGEVLTRSGEDFPELRADTAKRNRIARDQPAPEFIHAFNYWEIFLLKHQNRWNVAIHAVSAVYMYALAAWAAVTANALLLLLLPLSQLIGLLSHRLFENGHIDIRDAVFSTRATRSLNKMLLLLATRRYWPEVERARAKWAMAEAGAR